MKIIKILAYKLELRHGLIIYTCFHKYVTLKNCYGKLGHNNFLESFGNDFINNKQKYKSFHFIILV